MRTHASIWCVAVGAIGLVTSGAAADIPYFNGFETPSSVNDFLSPLGQAGVGITRVASGGGTLGYTPAAGSFYAEIQNVDNFGGPNMGYAGGTQFGTPGASSPSGFGESVDIYIDTARWLPPSSPGSGFVISTTANVVNESYESLNFIFGVTQAGAIDISSATPQNEPLPPSFVDLTTITKSGWYRLQATFVPGATNVENDVSVLDAQGNVLGTTHFVAPNINASGLIGPGNMLFGPWQTGFAGDVLAIDDLQTFAVPEPAIFATALIGLSLLRRRR